MKVAAFCLMLFAQHVCARTWYQFEGHEYYIEFSSVNSYTEAEAGCAARNVVVAYVKTNELHLFLVDKFGNLTEGPYSFYIGARRNQSTHEFLWTDGTSVNLTQPQWKNGEPNDRWGSENCVTMGWYFESWAKFWWIDISCSTSARYVCQRKLPPTTTTTKTTFTTTTVSTNTSRKTSTTFRSTPTTTVTSQDSTTNLQSQGETTFQEKTFTRQSMFTTTKSQPDQERDLLLVAVIGPIAGFVIGLSVFAVILYCRKRQSTKTETKDTNAEYAEIDQTKINPQAGNKSKETPVYINDENQEKRRQSGENNLVRSETHSKTEDHIKDEIPSAHKSSAYVNAESQSEYENFRQ